MGIAKRMAGFAAFDRERLDACRASFGPVMRRSSSWFGLNRTVALAFGKYRGVPMSSVPTEYLRWLLKSDMDIGYEFRLLVELTVEDRRTHDRTLEEIGQVERKAPRPKRGPRIAVDEQPQNDYSAPDDLRPIVDPPFESGSRHAEGLAVSMRAKDVAFVRSVLGEGWPHG